MKKYLTIAIVALMAAGMTTGCASTQPRGVLLTEVKLPVQTTDAKRGSKIGKATCKSYLGLIATGDASIENAMKSAGITRITHIDWEAKNILGFVGEYTVIVYGE